VEDLIVDSLDDIPAHLESLKELFRPEGEKFKLVLPKAEDVSGLKSSKAKIEREARQLKTEFDAFKAQFQVDGEELTPETLQQLKELKVKLSEQEGKELVPKTELAKVRREVEDTLKKTHGAEVTGLRTENAKLKTSLEKVLIEDGLRTEAGKADFPTPLKKGAIDTVIKIARADGSCKVEDGKAIAVNAEGDTVSLRDWLVEQVGLNSFLAEESTGSGTGSGNAGEHRPVPTNKLAKDMNEREKVDYITRHGSTAWGAKILKERTLKAA
jgi:hypothetical protein